jgi:hypothetical protein
MWNKGLAALSRAGDPLCNLVRGAVLDIWADPAVQLTQIG